MVVPPAAHAPRDYHVPRLFARLQLTCHRLGAEPRIITTAWRGTDRQTAAHPPKIDSASIKKQQFLHSSNTGTWAIAALANWQNRGRVLGMGSVPQALSLSLSRPPPTRGRVDHTFDTMEKYIDLTLAGRFVLGWSLIFNNSSNNQQNLKLFYPSIIWLKNESLTIF